MLAHLYLPIEILLRLQSCSDSATKNGDDMYTGLQDIVELLSYTEQSHDGYKRFVAHVEREPLTSKKICISRINVCILEPHT